MSSIFAKQRTKSLNSTIFRHLPKLRILKPDPQHQSKESIPPSLQNQNLKGSQKQRDILELLKDDPVMRIAYIQKFMIDDGLDDDSSLRSSTKRKDCALQDSQEPYDL